jgi:hypothetical protein
MPVMEIHRTFPDCEPHHPSAPMPSAYGPGGAAAYLGRLERLLEEGVQLRVELSLVHGPCSSRVYSPRRRDAWGRGCTSATDTHRGSWSTPIGRWRSRARSHRRRSPSAPHPPAAASTPCPARRRHPSATAPTAQAPHVNSRGGDVLQERHELLRADLLRLLLCELADDLGDLQTRSPALRTSKAMHVSPR